MARAPAQSRSSGSFGARFFGGGGRLPPVVGLLIALTFVATIVGVVGARHDFPLVAHSVLVADRLRSFELWRSFTWIFFEADWWPLLGSCLCLYWIGRELTYRWGQTRFVLIYLATAISIAALVFLVSLLYRPIGALPYLGSWPVMDALIIVWASYYPTRQMRFFFAVTLTGAQLVWATVGMTVMMSLFNGLETFIPHFLGEALALAFVYAPSPRELWLERKLRGMEQKRRASHLRSVPREGKDAGGDQPPGGRWLN